MPGRAKSSLSVAILLLLTEALYLPPWLFGRGGTLLGIDYLGLHIHRIVFAREALFGPAHYLPAWYPRELLGAPFLANLQSFPWIPTRLILLFFDPLAAFGVGVALAAALSALFTYLYCRRAGLCEVGAVTAGWTFACAGFFASRVMAGHLPLLEAYPALPLLLWLSDRAVAPLRTQSARRDLAVLALASACVAAAGHPQVPAYALASAALYAAVRGRGLQRLKAVCAMALGAGTTLVVWWPMLLLIRQSTRVLEVATPSNDIAMPYGRLAALIRPGIDGWPNVMGMVREKGFDGYPNNAYFWDTCSYVGLLPLIAMALLLVLAVAKRQLPRMPWLFLTVLGGGALLFALPVTQSLSDLAPGTIFRSPARLLYLSTFAAAVALGFAVTAVRNSGLFRHRAGQLLVALCLLLHALDLGGFARQFLKTTNWRGFGTKAFDGILSRELKDGRIASDEFLAGYDDVGAFDSLLLANPYRALVGAAGAPPDSSGQTLDGASLPLSALRVAGVRFVITETERDDLALVRTAGASSLYRVSNPVPRAAFFARHRALFAPREKLLDLFLEQPQRDALLLPAEFRTELPHPVTGREGPATVKYYRPSSDEIRLETASGKAGFVHVLESYEAGWSAQVDGRRAPVTIANGFSMAVPVEAGRHTVRMRYRTNGQAVGWTLSLLCAALLALVINSPRRRLSPVPLPLPPS